VIKRDHCIVLLFSAYKSRQKLSKAIVLFVLLTGLTVAKGWPGRLAMRISKTVLWIAFICIAATTRAQGQVLGQPYRLSDKEVERIIKRIENQTKSFRKSLDSALDRSRVNGTRREDDINSFIKAFEEQTKRLHDRFDDHKSVAADVESVLNRASEIDAFMYRQRLDGRAEEDWAALKASLDELAQAYNVSWRWGGVGLTPATGDVPYRLNDKEIEQILRRIEQQSERFRSRLDSALDKSRLEGTRREDDINAYIKEFNDEVKRLRDRFEEHKSVAGDVQAVLDRAARIDEFMSQRRLSGDAQEEWVRLKANLDQLAQAYSVSWRWH
jgi:DNA repair exonuclease SbcCD ATPase subunit